MKKITLATIKKKIREGKDFKVKLVPSNIGPYNCWGIGYVVEVKKHTDFDGILNSFIYYNCNKETGMRVHYYLTEEGE